MNQTYYRTTQRSKAVETTYQDYEAFRIAGGRDEDYEGEDDEALAEVAPQPRRPWIAGDPIPATAPKPLDQRIHEAYLSTGIIYPFD